MQKKTAYDLMSEMLEAGNSTPFNEYFFRDDLDGADIEQMQKAIILLRTKRATAKKKADKDKLDKILRKLPVPKKRKAGRKRGHEDAVSKRIDATIERFMFEDRHETWRKKQGTQKAMFITLEEKLQKQIDQKHRKEIGESGYEPGTIVKNRYHKIKKLRKGR